jgi:hypothetical protein
MRVAVAGSIAQKPHQAGHTWQYLQYLLGLRRLGCEVMFLDRLTPDASRDANGVECAPEDSVGAGYLAGVMDEFGLGDSWSLAVGNGSHVGVSQERALAWVQGSDLLLNIMGFETDEEFLAAASRRVFIDTDPGFGQMWRDLGLADVFAGHDVFVTIGERIGRADCTVPTCGLEWVTTPQPVVLEEWPRVPPAPQRPFTTVGRWRGAYGPIDHGGRRYGLRVHEFRRFAALPLRSGGDFELALDIHPDETSDLELLRTNGWTLTDPVPVACTPDAYRRYLQASQAEVMIAKGMYVDSVSGWFSERSICYLASGRPVLAQDTGLADLYPVGDGLVTFTDLDEAVAGVEAIRAAPDHHSQAARALAEEHFDSDRVLTRLLDEVAA